MYVKYTWTSSFTSKLYLWCMYLLVQESLNLILCSSTSQYSQKSTMVKIRDVNGEQQQPTREAKKALAVAKALARKRKRQQRRTRDITKEERKALQVLKKKAKRIITGVRPGYSKSDRPQTESFTIKNCVQSVVCEMYLPDREEMSSLLAVAGNVHGLMETTDGKQTCIFTLGILCCINPDFVVGVPATIARMGFNIEMIKLPSQSEEYGIDAEDIPVLDLPSYWAIFGLAIIYIFKTATSDNMNHFSTVRMNALKAAAGVDPGVNIINPFSLSKAQSVRSVLGSCLYLKKRIIKMLLDMKNGEGNIHAVCRYVAKILEYNEMSAIMFPFETLVTTSSPILTDNRVMNEVMNFSEGLELISQSEFPQYFKYLAPPEQAARIERNRFPTLAAVGQKLKLGHMGQTSVKNLVGAEGKVNDLAEELLKHHTRYLARKQPLTLDQLVREVCRPAGATILGDEGEDSEGTDDDDDEEETFLD